MSQFDELLAQLTAAQEEQSTLAKAIPEEAGKDDEEIQTAAAEGADANPEDEEEEDEGADKAPLAKSLTVDGQDFEVVDAEELVKSLHDVTGRVTEVETVLAKGLEGALGLIKSQGELIKSMQDQIKQLGGKGAGRKTVLAVHEKQPAGEPLAKSQQEEGLTKEVFLAKSEAAWQANKISGIEYSTVDAALRNGGQLPPDLIKRIMS